MREIDRVSEDRSFNERIDRISEDRPSRERIDRLSERINCISEDRSISIKKCEPRGAEQFDRRITELWIWHYLGARDCYLWS